VAAPAFGEDIRKFRVTTKGRPRSAAPTLLPQSALLIISAINTRSLTMPQFDGYPRRYNSLRLLGYEYNSIYQVCAITLVTDVRSPLFADVKLAKRVLTCLLSDQTMDYFRVTAFTLMPDHLHLLAGVRHPESHLPTLIGRFKSYTTQAYWGRSREVIVCGETILPSKCIVKSERSEQRLTLSALLDWRATLRPEMTILSNWPTVEPAHFRKNACGKPVFSIM
jgi:REP element-mobilizing transposase RayT